MVFLKEVEQIRAPLFYISVMVWKKLFCFL